MPGINLLGMPIGNPFRIFHRKRTPKQVLGTHNNYHLTFERQELPDAGAGQYSWETYGLPPDAQFGRGNIHVEKPLRATFPASYTFQAVGIVGNPPTSIAQGQFVTQPLMDPTNAEARGIVLPGVLNGGPNAISRNAPVLAP